MRKIVAGVFAAVLAAPVSFYTGLLVRRTSEEELNTVGIIEYCGFPIWFYKNAPGISIMGGWEIDRLLMNTIFWAVILVGISLALMRIGRSRPITQSDPHAQCQRRFETPVNQAV